MTSSNPKLSYTSSRSLGFSITSDIIAHNLPGVRTAVRPSMRERRKVSEKVEKSEKIDGTRGKGELAKEKMRKRGKPRKTRAAVRSSGTVEWSKHGPERKCGDVSIRDVDVASKCKMVANATQVRSLSSQVAAQSAECRVQAGRQAGPSVTSSVRCLSPLGAWLLCFGNLASDGPELNACVPNSTPPPLYVCVHRTYAHASP